jgi:DNA-binding CsgD family transcriptional regulator
VRIIISSPFINNRLGLLRLAMLLLLLVSQCKPAIAQKSTLDSLKNELSISRKNRTEVLIAIAVYFHNTSLDSSIAYTEKALAIAETDPDKNELVEVYCELGRIKILSASFEEALDYYLKAEELCKDQSPLVKKNLLRIYSGLGIIYERRDELVKSLHYFENSIALLDEVVKEKPSESGIYSPLYNNLANTLIKLNDTAKAILYQKKGLEYAIKNNDKMQASILYNNIGKVMLEQHHAKEAFPYVKHGLKLRKELNDERGVIWSYRNMGLYYIAVNKLDSARYYVNQSILSSGKVDGLLDSYDAGYLLLSEIYQRQGLYDSALDAYKLHIQYRDSVYSGPKFKELARIEAKYEMLKKSQQELTERNARELKTIIIIAGLFVGLVLISLLYWFQKLRSNNQKLKYDQLQLREEKLVNEHKTLNLELEYKSKDLATHVLYLLKKDELITKIVQKLLSLKKELGSENQQRIVKITKDLRNILGRNDNTWQEFELRFKDIHKDFYEKLEASYPELTPKERRLCALLKLNMTTKEISTITHQSTRSIDVARTRLRRKFNLTNSEIGLVDFLSKF